MPPRLREVDVWLPGRPLALYPEARLVRWPLGVPLPAAGSWLDAAVRLLPCWKIETARALLLGARGADGAPLPWSELARAEAASSLGVVATARAYSESHARHLVAIGTNLCPYLREQIRAGTPAPFDRLNYVVAYGSTVQGVQLARWNEWIQRGRQAQSPRRRRVAGEASVVTTSADRGSTTGSG